MPMSNKERAALAGRARAASQTPEQRRESGRAAYMAGAVNTVSALAPDLSGLSPELRSKVRAFAHAVVQSATAQTR